MDSTNSYCDGVIGAPEYFSPYFSRLVPIVPGISRSHQKENLVQGTFTPFVVPAREVGLSWGEKSTNFWLAGRIANHSEKFFEAAIVFAGISISLACQRRETNLWQHKRKHGSGGDEEVSAFWRFTQSPTPGTSGRGLRVAVYAVNLFAACQ